MFLRIVSASFNEKFNNCLINALELIKEAKTGLDEAQREKHIKKFWVLLEKIKDEKLKDFVLNIYNDNKDKILHNACSKAYASQLYRRVDGSYF